MTVAKTVEEFSALCVIGCCHYVTTTPPLPTRRHPEKGETKAQLRLLFPSELF